MDWLSNSADLMYSMYMQTFDTDYESEYWLFADSWTFINSLSVVEYRIWFFQHSAEIEAIGYIASAPEPTQLQLFAA